MKQFFKFFTASCLGTIFALFLLIFIFSMYGAYMASQTGNISSNSILELNLSKQIPEKTNNVVKGEYDFDSEEYPGLRTIQRAIEHAKTDDKIKGIVLRNKSIPVGQSTLFEMLNSLESFKESGKFIYAYEDYYSQSAYLLATAADSIFLNPNGLVELKGYGTMIPFFKPLMDKLGVKFDIYYAGKFKSATEPYRRTSMSEANKKQTKEFLADLFDILALKLENNRGIDRSKLDKIINDFEGITADGSKSANLIDVIAYHNEFTSFLKDKVGRKQNRTLKTIDLEDYISKIEFSNSEAEEKIAVVFAEGDILYNTNSTGQVNDIEYLKLFDRIKRDEDIKALVLRVNSPGGSALTSDIIWNEIEEIKAKGIPVITSMGDYAASGGYYIACNSDTILAAPNTLTGSIGVFSMMPNIKKLLNEKVGIVFDTIRTHDLSLINNFVYDPSEKENVLMQRGTDKIYQQFLDRVANGRSMDVESVHEVAQGRVWTGKKAVELGLVDELGDLDDAIAIAAEMADIESYKISEYPKIKENPLKAVMKALEESNASIKPALFGNDKTRALYKNIKEFEKMTEMEGPLARMPFQILDF